MPTQKRQHYVPRCYLKPFSLNGEGSAINLMNFSKSKTIRNASLKGQCAKDYIYGQDLVIENRLKELEGRYAEILRLLQAGGALNEEELRFVLGFMHLQSMRTDMAVQRLRLSHLEMQNAVFNGQPVNPAEIDLSDKALMRDSIQMFQETVGLIEDLKVCFVKNSTQTDFITSDDPAIFTNRYHFQRLRESSFGLLSSGALLIMPITPRLLALAYDRLTYTVPDKDGHYVTIKNSSEIAALNELQYLKAAENIYFRHWDDENRISGEFYVVKDRRPKSWCEIKFFVFDGVDPDGAERFRAAASNEEAKNADRTMMQMSSRYPSPSSWISKLRYRSSIKTYYNGTAVGHVRKAEWLESTPE